jgi:hypothetical protein
MEAEMSTNRASTAQLIGIILAVAALLLIIAVPLMSGIQ